MNQLIKAAAVTAVVAIAASAHANYNGDLLVGFTQSGVGTTLVYDLGTYGSLHNGESWSLGSQLSGAGFTPNSVGFNTSLTFGVVGYSGGNIYSTFNTGGDISLLNNLDLSASSLATVKGGINSLGNNQGAQTLDGTGKGADWASETIIGGLNTSLVNNLFNPNATGIGTGNFLYVLSSTGNFLNNNNSDAIASPNNTFTLNGDGILTYGAPVVPEPSTYALLGLGVVAFALNRRFARKSTV